MAVAPMAFGRRPKLIFAAAEDVEDSFHGAWLKLIYADACGRLGYDLAIGAYPTRRATALSDLGTVAGEINRVVDYGVAHPNLIRINPSHFAMDFCAYGRASLRVGKGWRGLSEFGKPLIEYRSGVAKCHERLREVVPPARLSHVNNATLAVRKLVEGRTDLYVEIDSVVDRVLKRKEFANAPIRKLSVVETVEMHCYVHRSQRELVEPLSAALEAMHKDGSIDRYRKTAMAQMNLVGKA